MDRYTERNIRTAAMTGKMGITQLIASVVNQLHSCPTHRNTASAHIPGLLWSWG